MKKNKESLKQQAESIKKKIFDYSNQPGHRFPQTRREFLNSGILAVGTSLMAPTLTTLFARSAHAELLTCNNTNAKLPAFINLQLAGGPALFAQYIARGANGSDLGSYELLGMGSNPAVEECFINKAPFWKPDGAGATLRRGSGFLIGLKSRLGANFDAIVNKRSIFTSIACKSIDDRLTNKHDLSGMLAAAGLGGGTLPYLLVEAGGTNAAGVDKGVKRFIDAILPVPAYLPADSKEAIEASLGFKGSLLTQLSPGTSQDNIIKIQQNLLNLINDLTTVQAEVMLRAPGSGEGRREFFKLATCASQQNSKIIQEQATVKVGIEGNLTPHWPQNFTDSEGSFTGSFKNDVTKQIGNAVCSTLKDLSGACTAVIGGYDYHTTQLTTRIGQHNHDVFFGETIGSILLSAHQLQRPVFIYVSADGSVSSNLLDTSNSANTPWVGDYSERGMNYMIAYDPVENKLVGRDYFPANHDEYGNKSFQLNHFSLNTVGAFTDLTVAGAYPFANADAQELAAAAVFLNYLDFAGRKDILDLPALVAVKKKLVDAMPSFAKNIFDFYGRMGRT